MTQRKRQSVFLLLLWASSSVSAGLAINDNDIDNDTSSKSIVTARPQHSTVAEATAAAPSSFFPFHSPIGVGPIDEAMVACNMEDLEQANDSQLFTILQDLVHTAFFRTFRVDLSQKCPLLSWQQQHGHVLDSLNTDQQLESSDLKPEAADEKEEEDEFQCPSATGSVKDELGLDDHAVPLCTVQPEADDDWMWSKNNDDDNDLEFSVADSTSLTSNVLRSLSQEGFESEQQRKTFNWQQHSDKIESTKRDYESQGDDEGDGSNGLSPSAADIDDCNQNKQVPHLPQDFWIDLCTRVRNDDPTVVNLLLNPERNTGYNGTHIWKAIYEENCLAVSTEDECLEERVLYRLISGLHTSTTVSIAKNYYPPSKRKNRVDWEPNPAWFMERFANHADYIRNLHFSYVVLLRALTKASSYLYHYDIRTGDVMQDETAAVLLRRLLDSSILKSCSSVFSAFDESLLFASASSTSKKLPRGDFSLQHSFKDVFFNISSILDCVQCQQCKLHGKLSMLGYGTALKILFTSPQEPDWNRLLTRNEIVALINTLAKFSESIRHVRELTHLYVASSAPLSSSSMTSTLPTRTEQQTQATQKDMHTILSPPPSSNPALVPSAAAAAEATILSTATIDAAVGAIAEAARRGIISAQREHELIQLALVQRHSDLLILARHYAAFDVPKFIQFSQHITLSSSSSLYRKEGDNKPDAIVIGSGLAGMAAALNILDRGGRVIILEKEHLLGGNSNKASSGINACCPDNHTVTTDDNDDILDSVDLFRNDTLRSAGSLARPDLIQVLVGNSAEAVTWLRTRVGVDLSLKAQLGGHSAKRTHRPRNGMAGAEIIYGMQKALKSYTSTGRIEIRTDSKVTQILRNEDNGHVVGVEFVGTDQTENSTKKVLYADNIILATGGFAADRSAGSYLAQYRPELLKMPTTAGAFSTGDGVTLATALGAGRVDMDKVQVHPTGWVDPAEPKKTTKILAAELMRGVGGILINSAGNRFCNELGTRAYVTEQMLSHNAHFRETKQWDIQADIPTFSLVLSSSAAADGKKHVDLYKHKGLLTELQGVTALAQWMNLPKDKIVETLRNYQQAAASGLDEFGKTTFSGVAAEDLDNEVFYAGTVTPVLHYCMGGITIDETGSVLDQDGNLIPGLHAAGEVTGGVHGANRLAGNSLLECTVYGTIVGKKIPIRQTGTLSASPSSSALSESVATASDGTLSLRSITPSELAQHNTPDDCWVAIHGIVYDLTAFAEEHPAGPESIHVLAGKDGSEAFAAVHNEGILDEVSEDIVGKLVVGFSSDENTVKDTVTDYQNRIQEQEVAAISEPAETADAETPDASRKNAPVEEEPPSRVPSLYFWKSTS